MIICDYLWLFLFQYVIVADINKGFGLLFDE